jgi:hypothetical protein
LHDKIRYVLAYQLAFVQHLVSLLLSEGNPAQTKLHTEAVLINVLVQPVTANVWDLNGASHDRVHLFLE